MLCPKGIVHAGSKAQDLESLSAFYEGRIGLTLVERHDGCHIFDGVAGVLVEIWSGGTSSPNRKSPSQQSVRVGFLVEQLEPSIENLKARGVAPTGEIGTYLGTRWVHYTDPEDNTFGLVDSNG